MSRLLIPNKEQIQAITDLAALHKLRDDIDRAAA